MGWSISRQTLPMDNCSVWNRCSGEQILRLMHLSWSTALANMDHAHVEGLYCMGCRARIAVVVAHKADSAPHVTPPPLGGRLLVAVQLPSPDLFGCGASPGSVRTSSFRLASPPSWVWGDTLFFCSVPGGGAQDALFSYSSPGKTASGGASRPQPKARTWGVSGLFLCTRR